jgi:hypothetical protein
MSASNCSEVGLWTMSTGTSPSAAAPFNMPNVGEIDSG